MEDVPVIRETLGARQKVLLKEIVTDAAHSGAHIFRTLREVGRTGRDGSTPQDVKTAVSTVRLTLQSPNFIGTFDPPNADWEPRYCESKAVYHCEKAGNTEPLDAPINQFSAVRGHSMPIFSKVIGPKTVSGESTDVYVRQRMDFASNSVVVESPIFMDLGLSPANTTDKLKSVIGPTARVEALEDSSNWLASRHV